MENSLELPGRTMWDPINVVNAMLDSVELVSPSPRMFVGPDSKTSMLLIKFLPAKFIDMCIPFIYKVSIKPAAIVNKSSMRDDDDDDKKKKTL